MVQQQIQKPGGDRHRDEDEELAQAQIQTQSIDLLLDQIDTVLETDAQTFVDGFVQKGGQ